MAKPIKGTSQADLMLDGTDGNDNILGKSGNDTITGGHGNDSIDGGQGTDTAVYHGSIDDYVISFLGNHNGHGADDLRVSVSDTVNGRDGTDSLKAVEWLKFDDALVDLSSNVTHLSDHTLDASSYNANGPGTADDEMYFGDGDRPTHYNIAQINDQHIELGLKIHYRTGDDITPTSVDGDGTAHYVVPDGRQIVDPAHNVSTANPNRAAWNFDFSVNTGLDGSAKTLDDYDFRIVISDDDGNTKTFDLQHLGPGNTPWTDTPLTGGFADEDGSNPQLSQNSVNLGFNFLQAAFGPDFDAAGEKYDIQLQAFDHQNHLLGSVHDVLVLA